MKLKLYYKHYIPRGYWILSGLTKRALRFRSFNQVMVYLKRIKVANSKREELNENF